MLIVVQIGSTKRATFGLTLRLFSAQLIVIGKVPADDFEKKAINRALNMCLAVVIGFKPLASKNSGNTINA